MSDQSGFPDIFYLSKTTLLGLQAIRSYYGVPVRVNATGRTKSHNSAIGGASSSNHLLGQFRGAEKDHVEALDFDFFNKSNEKQLLKDFHYQMINGGPLRDQLYSIGIRGVGLYDNFGHIDSRGASDIVMWDERVSTKDDETFLASYAGNIQKFISIFGNPGEDGFLDQYEGLKKKA